MTVLHVRVPDALEARMEAHETVDWSAVIRAGIREELAERDDRNRATAVAKSERLSASIDPDEVTDTNTADIIRDRRYGPGR